MSSKSPLKYTGGDVSNFQILDHFIEMWALIIIYLYIKVLEKVTFTYGLYFNICIP